MEVPVLQCMPMYVDALAWVPYAKEFEEQLIVTPKFGEQISLSERRGDQLGVPRNCVIPGGTDCTTPGAILPPGAINCTVPPRNDEQKRVIKESLTLLKNGRSHIIKATTGFGKTYLLAAPELHFNLRNGLVFYT